MKIPIPKKDVSPNNSHRESLSFFLVYGHPGEFPTIVHIFQLLSRKTPYPE
jgi:hypothetical protein